MGSYSEINIENSENDENTIVINFNGVPFRGYEGQSIAALLFSNGIRVLRYCKSGEERGVFCGMGVCYDCAVSINGIPGKRACIEPAKNGINVKSLPYKAPNNKIPPKVPEYKLEAEKHYDIAIIGSGPAGLMTAITLVEKGLNIVIIDERTSLGGQYFKQLSSSEKFDKKSLKDYQYQKGNELIEKLKKSELELKLSNTVIAAEKISSDLINLSLLSGEIVEKISIKRLVVCTGAYEVARPFPGWTSTAVITTGAAQGLLRSYRINAGTEIVIAGNGPLNFQLAAELIDNGAKVIAVIEASSNPIPYNLINFFKSIYFDYKLMFKGILYFLKLRINRVPILFKHHVREISGKNPSIVKASPILKGGKLDTKKTVEFSADTLCVGYGFLSNNEIPRILGCDFEKTGGIISKIRCDQYGRTSLNEVFVIGDGAKIDGAQVALSLGEMAGKAILEDFNLINNFSIVSNNLKKKLNKKYKFQKAIWSLFKSEDTDLSTAKNETILCRCENVTSGRIDEVLSMGVTDLGSVKRLTRAGMGRCQGRYCTNMLLKKINKISNLGNKYDSFLTQIPIKPIPILSILREEPEWKGYKPEPVSLRKFKDLSAKKLSDTKQITKTDVAIIGGGAIGVSISLYLSKNGVENNLIESSYINSQASGNNAGSLHLQLLSFDFELDKKGESPQLKSLVLQKKGIELWKSLEKDLESDFELEITGGLMVAETEKDISYLKNKIVAEKKVGVEMELLSQEELREKLPNVSDKIIAAAYCPGEGKINPMLATPILAKESERLGTKFNLETTVISISKEKNYFLLETNKGKIKCKYLVNAAGGWSSKISEMLGLKIPVLSAPQQMIVTESSESIIKSLISHAHRHLTMKQIKNGNIIIGGGWFAGYNNDLNRTINYSSAISGNLWVAQRVFPNIGYLNVLRTWATVGVMIDGAPIIGETPGIKNFYHAVGANGYTMAPEMGNIISKLILGKSPETEIAFFSLNRF